MSIYIITGLVLAVAITAVAAARACRIRERRNRAAARRHVSTYIIKNLTQPTFTKAVNIVTDLVRRDGADIEVVYKDEVLFNGYTDRDGYGNGTPRFWYNKKVLDANGIKYRALWQIGNQTKGGKRNAGDRHRHRNLQQ